jgi:hypothetical protein
MKILMAGARTRCRRTWGRPLRLSLLCWSGGVGANAHGQAVEVRYGAAQLNCARFLESSDSDILTQSGGRAREQTAGRTGVWQFRAQAGVDRVALEGWLDSLALWRQSKETTIRPDTDGLLGGRYRGTLSGDGAYESQMRPFVPDEVAEVANMATALDDFFPPLPPKPLRPGQAWSDSSGVTLRRLADSGMSGVSLYRFELEARRESHSAPTQADTAPIRLRQVSQERGIFVWHPSLGLVRRDRRIVVETSVPPGRSVRQAVRSKIEQRITILRDLAVPPEAEGRCSR